MILALIIVFAILIIVIKWGDKEKVASFFLALIPGAIAWLITGWILSALQTGIIDTYETRVDSWANFGEGFVLSTPDGPIVVDDENTGDQLKFNVIPTGGRSTYFKYCDKPHPWVGFDLTTCTAEVRLNSKDIDK